MSKKKNNRTEYIIGVFSRHRKGFGFVKKDGSSDNELDIYISPDDTKGAMNGDLVAVDIIPEWYWMKDRPEGIITRIIEHNVTEVTGTFKARKKGGVVIPADRRHGMVVAIGEGHTSGARTGDKVVASILKYPDRGSDAKGHITSIIAKSGQPGADVIELLRSKGYLETFPSSAMAQAKFIEKQFGNDILKDEDISLRRDLRGKKIFTIDGAYSKDFDDAVSIEKTDDGKYILGVHIADVTHYVQEKSPLDREALKRGNSVYVLDKVVPMLPFELSNGICSLNEGVDRLCLSIDMIIDDKGQVTDHNIYESVICSCHRLVYDDVSDILEKEDKKLSEKYLDILDDLFSMKELFEILSRARDERGSIDFDVDEPFIELDKEGIPVNISVKERRTADRIIEEFMLLANETVAQHFFWMEAPFIYRVHQKPETKKMAEFRSFLQSMSITFKADVSNVHPKTLSMILESVEGTDYENVVGTVMLRCMQKAIYSTDCGGHYGLSLKYYCHFTSPIRRYADLFIHRVIKEYLKGEIGEDRIAVLSSIAVDAADHISATERLAVEVERDGDKMKEAQYMSKHIGEKYDAVISGVSNSGFFVQLDNTIEGMVRLESIGGDYYLADVERYRVIGIGTGKIFRLGNKIKVICDSVDLYDRTIDFRLVNPKKKNNRRKRQTM